jgi:hypothetical protein
MKTQKIVKILAGALIGVMALWLAVVITAAVLIVVY